MYEIKTFKFAVLCWMLILLGSIFLVLGCQPVYKALGFTDQESVEQWQKDKEHIIGAIEEGREGMWQIISAVLAASGAIVSGLLGKWLSTEKRVSATLIKGIETAESDSVKKTIHKLAVSSGVEKVLSKKVKALT